MLCVDTQVSSSLYMVHRPKYSAMRHTTFELHTYYSKTGRFRLVKISDRTWLVHIPLTKLHLLIRLTEGNKSFGALL